MISVLLTAVLATQSINLPSPNQEALPQASVPVEALNALLDYPAGYAALRACGRPVITSVTSQSIEGPFIFEGYHLMGDIILGDFSMNLTIVGNDPKLGFSQYEHELTLKYDAAFACPSSNALLQK